MKCTFYASQKLPRSEASAMHKKQADKSIACRLLCLLLQHLLQTLINFDKEFLRIDLLLIFKS